MISISTKVVGTARSAVVSKCGGTPPHFDKLNIRQGWAVLRRFSTS